MTVLCMATCARKGWHVGSCDDRDCAGPDSRHPHCAGCEPWPAADGVNLCDRHLQWLGENAVEAAALYDELALVLAGGGSAVGEKTSGSKASIGINLSDAAVRARHEIRNALTTYTRMVADERGVSGPETALSATESGERVEDELRACGAFLAVHADWLAAHSTAGEVADELSALVRAGRAAAYPGGTRTFPVAPCKEPECSGQLRATIRPTDDQYPSYVACDSNVDHQATFAELMRYGHRLAKEGA